MLSKYLEGTKAAKYVKYITIGSECYDVYLKVRKTYNEYKSGKQYHLTIPYSSWFAVTAFGWALGKSNYKPNRITAITDSDWDDDFTDQSYSIDFLAAVNVKFSFMLNGHKINATLIEKDQTGTTFISSNAVSTKEVYFTTESMAGMDVLSETLKELHDREALIRKSSGTDRRNFYVYGANGNWSASNRAERPISSVILKGTQVAEVTKDLEDFYLHRDKYIGKGIPWRRGYLFHGPPGTGKSSIVKGLASHVGMDLYYVSLKDVDSDAHLISAVSRIKGKGALLIEDVDAFTVAKQREKGDEGGKGVSLSGLLNVIDGPASPDGLVTFMTTNHLDHIDPALIRKGRVDYTLEVGLPNLQQIKDMWRLFYETDAPITRINGLQTTSFYFDIFKRNLEDPETALLEIEASLDSLVE